MGAKNPLLYGLINLGKLGVFADTFRKKLRRAAEQHLRREINRETTHTVDWQFARFATKGRRTQVATGRLTVKEALFGVSGFPGRLWFREEYGVAYIILRGVSEEEFNILLRMLDCFKLRPAIHINSVRDEAD